MQSDNTNNFKELSNNLGKINLRGKTVLIPEMNRIGAHLFAANFRSFGVNSEVLETYKGCDLGKQYTSGKECYPCLVTLGDMLYFAEKKNSNGGFIPENYVYFLPESEGPCRFGMYNKFQRIIFNGIPELSRLKIASLSARDGYCLDGILEKDKVLDFRKSGYFSFVIADILDRLTWRVRPYERKEGMTNAFIKNSMYDMGEMFERYGSRARFDRILDKLAEIVQEAKDIIDPNIPPKPLIGIVGEIFLRMHAGSNQDLIQMLERHGAEVVNASLAEWVNYVTYNKLRESGEGLRFNFKRFNLSGLNRNLKNIAGFGGTLLYQQFRQKQAYRRVGTLIDLAKDHKISHLRDILEKDDSFSFQVITETCISIAAILEYARMGCNGVVNVYPFTCMPGMTTSAIAKPIMIRQGVPYLDTPYDGTTQPGSEATVRTFVYQAEQHLRQKGRGSRSNRNIGRSFNFYGDKQQNTGVMPVPVQQ
jgi:predicted nucleotide-binding protein (sugar kinase/HSP70/actin superfamily)